MNLENLNKIANEEKDLLQKAKKLDEQSEYLAKKRNSERDLSSFILEVRDPSYHNYPKFYDEAIQQVMSIVNSISHDVFRAAEMKFAAEARALRIEAKLKNQQIKNFLPDSEVL